MSVEGIGAPCPDCGDYGHDGPHAPSDPMKAVQITGEQCYVDTGEFVGTELQSAINWYPSTPPHTPCYDKTKLDAALNVMMTNLAKAGVTTMNLAFGQLADLDALESGTAVGWTSKDDTFLNFFKGYPDSDPSKPWHPLLVDGENLLTYFCSYAHQMQPAMKVQLSFGGADGSGGDFKLPGDPTASANTLAEICDKYGIDGVGFDMENPGIVAENGVSNVETFFQTLKQKVHVTATLLGSTTQGVNGALAPLLNNFTTYFDEANLMLYDGGTHYYLSAHNANWGVQAWMKKIPPADLHIGFYPKIPYNKASANSDPSTDPYNITSGASNGTAAGEIYLQLLKNLGLTTAQMGAPFFWVDQPQQIAPGQPPEQFMEDFYKTVGGNVPPPSRKWPYTATNLTELKQEMEHYKTLEPTNRWVLAMYNAVESMPAGSNLSVLQGYASVIEQWGMPAEIKSTMEILTNTHSGTPLSGSGSAFASSVLKMLGSYVPSGSVDAEDGSVLVAAAAQADPTSYLNAHWGTNKGGLQPVLNFLKAVTSTH